MDLNVIAEKLGLEIKDLDWHRNPKLKRQKVWRSC